MEAPYRDAVESSWLLMGVAIGPGRRTAACHHAPQLTGNSASGIIPADPLVPPEQRRAYDTRRWGQTGRRVQLGTSTWDAPAPLGNQTRQAYTDAMVNTTKHIPPSAGTASAMHPQGRRYRCINIASGCQADGAGRLRQTAQPTRPIMKSHGESQPGPQGVPVKQSIADWGASAPDHSYPALCPGIGSVIHLKRPGTGCHPQVIRAWHIHPRLWLCRH